MTFIDGHNVLHVVPELREILNSDLVTAMQRLVGRVFREKDTIVVFDGNPPHPFNHSNRQVVFVSSDDNFDRADRYILNFIRTGKTVNVVTSDSEFASSVKQLGGKVINPCEWYGKSGARSGRGTPYSSKYSSEKKRGPGGTHTEWVELFRKGKPE